MALFSSKFEVIIITDILTEPLSSSCNKICKYQTCSSKNVIVVIKDVVVGRDLKVVFTRKVIVFTGDVEIKINVAADTKKVVFF